MPTFRRLQDADKLPKCITLQPQRSALILHLSSCQVVSSSDRQI